MKSLRIIYTLFLSMIIMSCSSDDVNSDTSEGPEFQATINGGTFSNYSFELGVYDVLKGAKSTTLKIILADKKGKQMTLFLNSSGGFKSGAVKQMGDVDSDKFKTYIEIKDNEPSVQYFSQSGALKITNNRAHPSDSQKSMISGEFNIVASTIDGKTSLTMKGSFKDLIFVN